MRKYVDLHVRPHIESTNDLEDTVKIAAYLGFHALGIVIPQNLHKEITNVKKICLSYGIEFISRLDITSTDKSSILRNLEKFRTRFEIVGVIYVPGLMQKVPNDRRIDVISLSSTIPPRAFSLKEAKAVAESSSLEINMSDILRLAGLERAEYLSQLSTAIYTASRAKMKIIVSSGAENKYFMRSPKDLAFFATLLNLDPKQAIKAVSEIPLEIVKENRLRLSPNYIGEGVRLVGCRRCQFVL